MTVVLSPIAIHNPYKSDYMLCKNTIGIKKVQTSKVEPYLQIGDNKI